MPKAVKLRGHHLLCVLSYCAKGYTPSFVKNFDAIVERINNGAFIEIVTGIDSICAALQHGVACEHAAVCRQESVKRRDRAVLKAVIQTLQRPIKVGDRLVLKEPDIHRLRQSFAAGPLRQTCSACPWFITCSQIAAKKFVGIKLFPKKAQKKPAPAYARAGF